jgi:hypothetical protein
MITTTNTYYDTRMPFPNYPNMLFVFGSNLAGRHGRGAAKDALNKYGAIYGMGQGMQGDSYAIPTKDHNIQTLPLEQIANFVETFKRFTLMHPDLTFYVTAIGTGLAGYQHHEIAPMFKGVQNCWLPLAWRPYTEIIRTDLNKGVFS